MATAEADKTKADAPALPRTERGRRTLRKLLDAAAIEFGEKGYHETSIVSITARAGVALGSFYTYFPSKEAIFKGLVRDMSAQVGRHAGAAMQDAADALDKERLAFQGFLEFVREHKEIYRIVDEAEFVDPESYRGHYTSTAERILARLKSGAEAGEIRGDVNELHSWAIMGMNVFLGLRYSVWSDDTDISEVARICNDMITNGIRPKS